MPAKTGTMKVMLEGRGALTLHASDHLFTGGEGTLYRANNTVVKIYTNPMKMINDRMVDKVRILAMLCHPYVVAPEGIVIDAQGKPIGFYMPFAQGEHLPRIFTNAFRDREGFGDDDAKKLAERMREAVQFAHDHRALLIDPNPMNWLIALKKKHTLDPEPRIIDVDSWVIAEWPPCAIMPSIRDWHATQFNALTDWFSWGVVTFELFTGIHPYKGTLSGYKRGDFEARMRDNASVFAQGIGLPDEVRDFTRIPSPLLDWYQGEFQAGERSIPPSVFTPVTTATPQIRKMRMVATAEGLLIFERLLPAYADKVVQVWPCGVAGYDSGTLVELSSGRFIGTLQSPNGEVVKVAEGWLVADWIGNELHFEFIDQRTLQSETLPLAIKGYALLRYENRLLMVTEHELVELEFIHLDRPILSVGHRTAILEPHAVRWFRGVGIEQALGATYIITPFGAHSCTTMRVRELEGLQPVNAKAGNRFVAVVAVDKNGVYRRMEFSMSQDYGRYTVWEGFRDNADCNMAILPRGVCATIVNDGELIIFVPSSGQIRRIPDRTVTTGMALSNWDNRVVSILDGQLWSVRMA